MYERSILTVFCQRFCLFLFFFYIYPVRSQQLSALTKFLLSILSVVLCGPFHVLLSPNLSMFICNLLSSLCCAFVSFFCPYFLFFVYYCLSLIVVRFYNFTVICQSSLLSVQQVQYCLISLCFFQSGLFYNFSTLSLCKHSL